MKGTGAAPIDSLPPSITVAIVDGDCLARRALRGRLAAERDIEVAGEAPDASTAIELAKDRRPDVVLIELALPDRSGSAAISEILAVAPQTRVIVLAVDADEEAQIRALRSGAAGCLSKSIDLEVLPRVLRGVRAGEAGVTRALASRILDEVNAMGSRNGSRLRPVRSSLTQRQWQVLDLLVEGATTEEIARELRVTPATVRTHVKHMLRKLGLHSRDEAVRYVKSIPQLSRGRIPGGSTGAT